MARARRLRRNPSIPRLEWVAKNYPEWIWLDAVEAFMLAVGMDDSWEEFAGLSMTAMDESRGDAKNGFGLPDELGPQVAEMIRQDGFENTEYDKYIPWVAKRLNDLTKPIVKGLRKRLKKKYPDLTYYDEEYDLERPIWVSPLVFWYGATPPWPTRAGTLRDALEAAGLMGWYLPEVNRYYQERGELRESFGTVARWANETLENPDLYTTDEAIAAAKEWARTRPKSEDIVGGDVVYEFDDGWTFQELKTGAQLRCEGEYLDHCVKGYKPSKIGNVYRIYSLRDPDGRPVATMEWNVEDQYIKQFKTVSNELPFEQWFEKAVEFRKNYIDKELVQEPLELEEVPESEWPLHATEWKGQFLGMYRFRGKPDTAFAIYNIDSLPRGRKFLVMMSSLANPQVWDTEIDDEGFWGEGDEDGFIYGGSIEDVGDKFKVQDIDPKQLDQEQAPLAELREQGNWVIWREMGLMPFRFRGDFQHWLFADSERIWRDTIGRRARNPRKRRNTRKSKHKRKAPEYKRLIDRCHKLWESYDAKPLKRNLVAFGKHIESMKKSDSAKVKTEAQRAARAFNKEFKARGWKR